MKYIIKINQPEDIDSELDIEEFEMYVNALTDDVGKIIGVDKVTPSLNSEEIEVITRTINANELKKLLMPLIRSIPYSFKKITIINKDK